MAMLKVTVESTSPVKYQFPETAGKPPAPAHGAPRQGLGEVKLL